MDDPPDIPAKIRRIDTPDIFKLNEDCLAKILTYLKLEDVLKFASVDERFNQAVQLRSTNYDGTVINDAFLTLPGISRRAIGDALDAISRRASRLKLVIADELRFRETVCHFRHLRDLTLTKVCLSGVEFDILPDKLERLKLRRCETKRFDLLRWFKILNPTLKTLVVVDSVLKGVHVLTNLTHLQIAHHGIRAGKIGEQECLKLMTTLINNKDNLNSLKLRVNGLKLPTILFFMLEQLETLDIALSNFLDSPFKHPNGEED